MAGPIVCLHNDVDSPWDPKWTFSSPWVYQGDPPHSLPYLCSFGAFQGSTSDKTVTLQVRDSNLLCQRILGPEP